MEHRGNPLLYMNYGQTKDDHKVLSGTTYCLGLHRPTINIKGLYYGQKGLVDELDKTAAL